MHVVLAAPLYPPEIGGPATDAKALFDALLAQGTRAVVVPFSKVRHFPPGIRHMAYMVLLLGALPGARALVAFDTVSVGFPCALVAKFTRVPLVVRVPGDYAWEQGTQRFGVTDTIDEFQGKRYGSNVETLRKVQRFVLGSARLVLVPSDYFLGIASSWGVRPERLKRIYLGLDFPQRERAVGKEGERIMFSLGRFVPWKGFSALLRLLPSVPGWHLVIAGDGPLRGALEEEARALGVAGRVTFTGVLPREEVLAWFSKADAFILNTSQENFSFQVLEGMASGAPVITTNVGSLPELVTDGVEGRVCAPDDLACFKRTLESVVTEPEAWERMTRLAQAKAATFSARTASRAFAQAVTSL